MGSVYRGMYTKQLPSGAELFTRNGDRFARWKPKQGGRAKTARVTTGQDGSLRILIESGTYIAKYRDGDGLVVEVSTGCREEDAARSVLSKLERRAELVKAEVMTKAEASTADHQGTPLSDHFAAYHEHRTAKGLNAVRIANTKARLGRLASECEFRRLADCSADGLTRWLNRQQAIGMSAGNRNEYRQEFVGFGNWCVESHRLSVNPFSNVPKGDANGGKRRQRRAMTEAELMKLLYVARLRPLAEFGRVSARPDEEDTEANNTPPKRSNWTKAALTLDTIEAAAERARKQLFKNPDFLEKLERLGWERALIYKMLLLTGLRRNELASLTVGQLELNRPMPFVVLHAADEKNRQGSTIPLRADLANDLTLWLSDIPKPSTLRLRAGVTIMDHKRPLFTVPAGLVRILDRDLDVAGIAKKDERGRTIDVHALRTSFGTLLSIGGVAPRTAQAAMRHSTIDLTMNVYTDPKLLDVHGALNSLPSLDLNTIRESERTTMKATGTDSKDNLSTKDRIPQQLAPMLAPNSGQMGQTVSLRVISSENDDESSTRQATAGSPPKPSKKALSTVFVNKALRVERKGVEPSTSALRTQRSPN
jgi:integrase